MILIGLAATDRTGATREEIDWQLDRMTGPIRSALRLLPPVGEKAAGPLGKGLLASGTLGTIIEELQARLAARGLC